MAIARDTSSKGTSAGFASFSWSHTCTGSNLILIVGVQGDASVPSTVNSVTYNGVALTQIGNTQLGNSYAWLGYLINPATGANTVQVNRDNNSTGAGFAVSYTGAKQASQPDASATNNANTSSLTTSVITVDDNSWLVGVAGNDNGGTPGVGAGTTQLQTFVSTRGGELFDSNGAKTPAGSSSLVATNTIGQNISMVIASIAPVATAFTVSVSDSIAIAEAITLQETSFISKSESISIAEAVTMQTTSFINKSDALSIGEAITLVFVMGISVTDSLVITESVTVRNSTLGVISVSDSVTITDHVSLLKYPVDRANVAFMRSAEDKWPLGLDAQFDRMRSAEDSWPLGMDGQLD